MGLPYRPKGFFSISLRFLLGGRVNLLSQIRWEEQVDGGAHVFDVCGIKVLYIHPAPLAPPTRTRVDSGVDDLLNTKNNQENFGQRLRAPQAATVKCPRRGGGN